MSTVTPLEIHSYSLKTFSEQLQRYKALVYEQYVTPLAHQTYRLEDIKRNQPAILVVEDNVDEWFLIRHTLLGHFPQIELVWAATPQEATHYFQTCLREERPLPCCILVDVYLPRAQLGLGLIKTLKAHRLFRETPFIALSRSDRPDDRHQALLHASDHYIVKPDRYLDWPAAFSLLTKYVPPAAI